MALRRKIYSALIVALAVGGIVFHKSAVAIAEQFPEVFGINIYVVLLGVVYLIITISMIEYFIMYRLDYVDRKLKELKQRGYKGKQKILDTGNDDEIGSITNTINEMIVDCDKKNKELKKSDEMYSSIVEDAPLLVCRFLPDGTITFANRSYAEIYNKQKAELIGENVYRIIEESGGKPQSLKRNLSLLRPDKESNACFYDIPTPKENSIWFMWVNRAFFDEFGKVVEYQTVGIDVYQQTTSGINDMMNNILSLVYFVNKDGKLNYASPSNESILGHKPSDMIGKSIFDFIHDDNRKFLEEQFKKRFLNELKETSIQELRIKNNNDQYTWVQAAIDSIVASNGSVANVAINAKDITELKDADHNLANAFKDIQKILEQMRTLEFIVEKSPVITFVWKKNSPFKYVSKNVSVLGYSQEDFTENKILFEDIIHSEDKEKVISHITEDVSDYVEFDEIQYRLLKKSGEVQNVVDKVIAIKDEDGDIVFYRGIELTNKKQK